MNRRTAALLLTLIATTLHAARATPQPTPAPANHYFTTSDHVRLHYTESGPPLAPTLIFIPGWTLPAWIFTPQIAAFSPHYHVIAFDPRGQGQSQIATSGYNQIRRGQDIASLIAHLGVQKAVLIGWSLGVLDSLAYIHEAGDSHIAALVLVDNSVGENPPPQSSGQGGGASHMPRNHTAFMHAFIPSMFHTPQPRTYITRLINASLRLPAPYAHALLSYPVPRTYWREALFSTSVPVLYIVRPHLAGQARNLLADRPNTQTALFPTSGHALFVDNPTRFNSLLSNFLSTITKPGTAP